jgi:hypothetical protein
MCLKDNIFDGRNTTDEQRKRQRAAQVKLLLDEAESKRGTTCFMGDAAVNLLREEQYQLARSL